MRECLNVHEDQVEGGSILNRFNRLLAIVGKGHVTTNAGLQRPLKELLVEGVVLHEQHAHGPESVL